MKKSDNRQLEGSFTVEMSFIMPLILGMIFAYLFLLFYLHDHVVLDSLVCQDMIWMAEQPNGKAEQETYVERLNQRLWLYDITEAKLDRKRWTVKTSYEGTTGWKIPIMNQWFRSRIRLKDKKTITTITPDMLHRWKGEQGNE